MLVNNILFLFIFSIDLIFYRNLILERRSVKTAEPAPKVVASCEIIKLVTRYVSVSSYTYTEIIYVRHPEV